MIGVARKSIEKQIRHLSISKKDITKIAKPGILDDNECTFLITTVLKMIDFEDVLYQFIEKQLKQKAEQERDELASAYESGDIGSIARMNKESILLKSDTAKNNLNGIASETRNLDSIDAEIPSG